MEKLCKTCGIIKDLSEFHNQKSSKDGKKTQCKDCINNKQKLYDSENKKYSNQNQDSERSKQYYIDNKEYLKNYAKLYYSENKEDIKQYSKDSYSENKNKTNNLLSELFECEIKKTPITYFIKTDNFYKIGKTTSFQKRIQYLNQFLNIEKIYVIDKNIESRILKELSEYRFKNELNFKGKTECFNLSNDIFEFIKNKELLKEFNIF